LKEDYPHLFPDPSKSQGWDSSYGVGFETP
jgi:hypothetical protein